MDRRCIIAVSLAFLGICGPSPLGLAQPNFLPRPTAQYDPIDQMPQPLWRLPRAYPAGTQLVRLPPPEPTTGRYLDLVPSSRSPGEGGVQRSRQGTHRRDPPTDRISPPGWERDGIGPGADGWDPRDANLVAVGNRVQNRIEAGFKLANKGAMYGARAEFRKAFLTVAEALDAQYGVTGHRQATHEALQAIKESADFSADEAGNPGRVEQIVATHQTPVLKQGDIKGMPALIAMQRYHVFAQQRLVAASGGAPVASNAMYAMGKLHMALADSASQSELDAAKAMTFLQAALMVDANNFAAANELGVMLARFGHLREARQWLRHSASVRAMPETWKNLEIVHRRLGEDQLADRARLEWQRQIPPASGAVAGNTGTVQWVAPEAFAGPPSGTPPPPAVAPSTAEKSSGFSLWPWR